MTRRYTQFALILFALIASARAFAQTAPAPSGGVDLNTATEKELLNLPGIGPSTARKIIEGRPYASVSDLSRAGVSKRQIHQITPMVTVGGSPMGTASRALPPPQRPAPQTAAPPAPGTAGMVWVNTATKVYHKQGDRYYGKTRQGKYMTESEAIQQGYRAAKK